VENVSLELADAKMLTSVGTIDLAVKSFSTIALLIPYAL
jgi:hypothetical protein